MCLIKEIHIFVLKSNRVINSLWINYCMTGAVAILQFKSPIGIAKEL